MLTASSIEHEIRELFGRGRRDLEIETEGFAAAIEKSLRMFRRHLYAIKHKVVLGAQNKQVVDVTADDASGDPAPLGVIDIKFLLKEQLDDQEIDIFQGFVWSSHRYRRYSSILLEKLDQENRQRVLGTEPEWTYDRDTKQLFLYVPSGPVDIGYTVSYPITSVSQVPVEYEALFMDCVEAHIRLALGDIRGKFGNRIPGPTGDITLDGSEQRSLGNDMLVRVREELAAIQPPEPPMWG